MYNTNLDTLVRVGYAIFGRNWQTPMAKALGPYHPSKNKVELSSRTIRLWVAGKFPVPTWAIQALPIITYITAEKLEDEASRLRQMVEATPAE